MLVSLLVATFGLIPAPATSQDTQPPPPVSDLQRLVTAALQGTSPELTSTAPAYPDDTSHPLPAYVSPQQWLPIEVPRDTLNDGYTSEQDAIINRVNQQLLNLPLRPNTAADLAKFTREVERYRQIQQTADASALIAMQQVDSQIPYFQDVLRAGGDPNVFFQQNPLPYTYDTSFRDSLSPEVAFYTLDPIGTTLNAINTSMSRVYPSSFISDLHEAIFTPDSSADIDDISLTPRIPPGTCSIGDIFQPTTITFQNIGSRPALVSLLDYSCQEIPYGIVFPGNIFTEPTFVGQTWFLRDGFTGLPLIGQPQFVIPNQQPQFYTIFDLSTAAELQGQVASPEEGANLVEANLSQDATSGLEVLKARYAAIREMQLGNYYSDPNVSALRTILNQQILLRLQNEPHYLYWQHELARAYEDIESGQPSYARLRELTEQVDSWTAPAADAATQQTRYAIRQEVLLLQSQLELEIAIFLDQNPALKQRLDELAEWLDARVEQVTSDPEFVRWYADWLYVWNAAYLGSPASGETAQAMESLVERYPTFGEFQRLRRELVDLTPALDETAPAQRFAAVLNEVVNDTDTDQRVNEVYAQYLSDVQAIMEPTDVPVLLENYYNRLNGLLQADPTYRELQQQDRDLIGTLEARQAQVHAAVAACMAENPSCDPYTDPDVTTLLDDNQSNDLIAQVGEYYERYNRFWYSFYTSEAYLDIENQAKETLAAPLSALQPELQRASERYETRQANIPNLQRLRTASETMLAELCDTGPQLSSGPISDPSEAVCTRLEQLRTLDAQLGIQTRRASSEPEIYLPLILR
jgi:hypothetical protein